MRGYQRKNQLLLLCLAVGFLIGIIYENVVVGKEVIVVDLFLKSNLQLYLQTNIITEKYFLYVLKERLLLLLAICILGCLKWKRVCAVIVVVIVGFLLGILTVASILQLGIKGIFLCIVGSLPQSLFYGMSFYIMLTYWWRYPEQNWNHAKSIFTTLMFVVGILMEVYVNPVFVKWILKTIC